MRKRGGSIAKESAERVTLLWKRGERCDFAIVNLRLVPISETIGNGSEVGRRDCRMQAQKSSFTRLIDIVGSPRWFIPPNASTS
jgi:hypothetical protein